MECSFTFVQASYHIWRNVSQIRFIADRERMWFKIKGGSLGIGVHSGSTLKSVLAVQWFLSTAIQEDLIDEVAVFVKLLWSNEPLLRGQTGTSLFWCQTWTISGHKLDFSRADYNSRKKNKNRCLFHLLSVMYQLTENKQNTMILLTCHNHIKREIPEQRRYIWKLFLQLNWLSWIFPALYHPGLISYQR